MATGYSLRNTPTLLESIDILNLNRQKRKSFDQWIADLQALSGTRDVSQEDAQVQAAFAGDPKYYGYDAGKGDDTSCLIERTGKTITNVWYGKEADERYAGIYAAAECAEGRWREDHPNDPTEC